MSTEPPAPPAQPQGRKPPRFSCSSCKSWPGTSSPSKWGEHVTTKHGGINPNTWEPLRSRKKQREQRDIVAGVDVRTPAEHYRAVLADLEHRKAQIEAAIRTIRALVP